MFDLSGKTALVTGASGGHWRRDRQRASCARRARCPFGHADGGPGDAPRRARRARLCGTCDLGDKASVDELVKKAEAAAAAPIDILVNNAGITRDNLFMRMKDEEWDQVIAGQSLGRLPSIPRGPARDDEEALGPNHRDHLGRWRDRQPRAGKLCCSESWADRHDQGARGRSGLAQHHRQHGGAGLHRDRHDGCPDRGAEGRDLGRVPAGRLGDPRDVAAAVVYLASDEAAYVTGQTLHVNGGMAMV